MEIIQAKDSHIPEVATMWKNFMDFHSKLDSYFTLNDNALLNYENYLRENMKSDDYLFLVALDKEKVVGRAVCQIEKYPPIFLKEKYGHIWELEVKQEYQRKGVGEKLLNRMIDWCKSKDVSRIELEVQPKNTKGYSFWKEHEFNSFIHRMYLDL